MEEERARRLWEKYAGSQAGIQNKKELNLGPGGGRGRAMRAKGKPKDARGTVRRLLTYLAQDRGFFLTAIMLAVLHNVASLAASYLLRPLINRFIYYDPAEGDLTGRLRGLAWALLVLLFVYGVSSFAQVLQQQIMVRVSQRSLARLRKDLFEKLLILPVGYFDTNSTGDIMSRFTNDVDAVGELLGTTLAAILTGILTLTGTVVLMLYTNVTLGLLTILMVPVLTFFSRTIVKRGSAAYQSQQKALGILGGFIQETLGGQKVVKVFGHEEAAMEEMAFFSDRLAEAQIRAQFRSSIMGPVTHQLCNLFYALVATVGALQVAFWGFDIGGLAVSINYTRHFNRPINEVATQMNHVFSALAGAERVFAVLDQVPEGQEAKAIPLQKIHGEVAFSHVDFGYVPGRPVLHDITLHAEPGQRIAFVGSTGAGKTTITNLLSRFYDLSSGTITVDQVPIERICRELLRRNIAMVLQDTHLFAGTVRENIRYGRLEAGDEEVIEAVKAACAHDFITQLPMGYDTELVGDGENLSQGQRQLLNIARAAISQAPILILDEATSSVDTRTEKLIRLGMDALMEKATTFVVAHRLSTVRDANLILVLEKGRIIERGTHEELLSLGGRYADLYHEIMLLE